MSVPLGSWYKTYEGHGEKNQHIEKMRLQRKGNIEMQVRVTNIVGQIAAQHDKMYWKTILSVRKQERRYFRRQGACPHRVPERVVTCIKTCQSIFGLATSNPKTSPHL